ncbi:MAG: hypothetical protein M3083_19240 [Actinomycetota bacterium]|nr:hypothetical protein [Actinomycetota bacterium]
MPTSSGHSGGGPDNGEDIDVTLWIWPLPPPGPVTISCSWARVGLDQVSVCLDGDEIRAAAQKAEPFYSEPES